MRIIIFANGELSPPIKIEPDDMIFAADGGALHCLALGLNPNLVIGDFDSLRPEDLDRLKAGGAEMRHYPMRKDFTDLELAIQHAAEFKPDRIIVYGALGSRWDQTAANLLLAGAFPGLPISLLDQHQEIHYLHSGEEQIIQGNPGDTVSLIPLQAAATGVITQNLEYPLEDETLYFGSTRGISNVLLSTTGSVRLRSGLLMCVVIHQTDNRRSNASEIELYETGFD